MKKSRAIENVETIIYICYYFYITIITLKIIVLQKKLLLYINKKFTYIYIF